MGAFDKEKNRLILIAVSITLLVVILVVFCCNFSANKKSETDSKKEQIVATVGDMKVKEAEFRFFSTILMLEEEETVKNFYSKSDISAKDELKKYTSDFTKEYMIRVLEAKSAGVTLTEDEKAVVAGQIADDYEAVTKTENSDMTEEEFYKYYYGISKADYTKFWENWYLIDKHTKACEANADVSEESQRMAFEEYYDVLFTYHASVIPFVIDSTNTAETQKQNAEAALTRLEGGENFDAIFKEYNTQGNQAPLSGETKIHPADKDKYSDVYDWLRVNPTGNAGIVETQYAIYVVRLDEISDFDTLLNSETMLKWTRSFMANKQLEDILSSEKYKYVIDEKVYNAIDLSDVVDMAFEYWGNIWENEK